MLALLLSTYSETDEVLQWAREVVADSIEYVVGSAWRAPATWASTKRHIPDDFRKFLRGMDVERRQQTANATARLFGSLTSMPEFKIKNYLNLLLADKEYKKVLLGVGGGATAKKGAPLRRTYILPRVARMILAKRTVFVTVLEAAHEKVFDDAYENEGSHKPVGSAKKPELKRKLAEKENEAATLADSLRAETRRADQAVRRGAEARANVTAAVDRRVEKRTLTIEGKVVADATSRIALAVARAEKAERERDEAIKRASDAEKRARTAEHQAELKKKRELRAMNQELATVRAENFALRVENEKMISEVASVRAELVKHVAAHGKIWVPRRLRGKGAGRGRRHSNELRKIYMKLLTLFVPPNSLNEVFATVAVAIAGDYLEHEGMELPDDAFCRGLRAELAAVHRLTCGLAFAKSKRIM